MRKTIIIAGVAICIICVALILGIFFAQRDVISPQDLTLSDYPELFAKETVIVIGENASPAEKESAEAIATNLGILTGNKPEICNTKKIESFKYSYNLVIVGTPNSNKMLDEVYNMVANATRVTEEYPGEDKGILEILSNPWNEDKAMLLVEGSEERGVKAGSEMLEDEKIKELSSKTMITEFIEEKETKSDILDAIMDYIKRNHLDAVAIIEENTSWTRSSMDIRPGYSRYVYTSDGWTATIGYGITPTQRIYEVRVVYNKKIVWTGIIKNGVITETSYTQNMDPSS